MNHESASLQTYVTGFVLSVVLTMGAYLAVIRGWTRGHSLLALLFGLALAQFLVQLIFFLHVGAEAKPRWRRLTMVLMIFFVVVVVLGSVWIMYNLNYRMSPQRINQYMQDQSADGL